MTDNKPRNEWTATRRVIAILRRLLQGPASRAELIQAVLDEVGPEAYLAADSARQAAFKHDRERLKDKHLFAADFHYDYREGLYILDNPGVLSQLYLSSASLAALQLLAQTFAGEVGVQAEVNGLLDALIQRLPVEDRRRLEAGPVALDVFQALDPGFITPHVWDCVNRATRKHRKLNFNYLSPHYADQRPHYHEVHPYRILFRHGHWYLHAFDLLVRRPEEGEFRNEGFKLFRLTNILVDEKLSVSPVVLPPLKHRPPLYRVHYLLRPALGRGSISRHFLDMDVTRHADGSAEVKGFAESDLEAARILLSYGENCVVLGGTEVLGRVERAVRAMAQQYGFLDTEGC